MHESQIAKSVLDAVLERVLAEGGGRVREVRGWIAESELLATESLQFHFNAHARGTAAEGARLNLRLIRVPAQCEACECTWEPDGHVLLCPECGSFEAHLTGPTGLKVEAVDLDDGGDTG
ncbi:MAG: hydrogenase maturation nickel metallochaperone HypA/HybF [Planctomycetota bacterium]